MEQFEVILADGTVLVVEAPDAASARSFGEQYAQSEEFQQRVNTINNQQPTQDALDETARRGAYQQEFDAMPWYQKFMVGAGRAVDDTLLGVKDMFTDLTPEERSRANAGELGVHGGWGTAGEIAGDLAIYAIPTLLSGGAGALANAGGFTKAARGLNAFSNALRSNRLADAGTGVALEGMKVGNDYRSRGDRIGSALLGTGLGMGLGYGVNRALRGVKPTDEAVRLADTFNLQKMTPGDRAGGAVRGMEQTLAETLSTSKNVSGMREAALNEWSNALRGRATQDAGFSLLDNTSRGSWDDARKIFSDMYDDVWEDSYKVRPLQLANYKLHLNAVADRATDIADAGTLRRINRLTAQLDDQLQRSREGLAVPGRALQNIKDQLQTEIDALYNSGTGFDKEFMGYLESARNNVESMLPQSARDRLAQIGPAYREFKILQDAAANTPGPGLTPDNLSAALRRQSTPAQLASGSQRLQTEAEDAAKVFTGRGFSADESPTANTIARMVFNALALPATPFTNESMRRVMTGQTVPQRAGAKFADVLRLNERLIPVTGARLGAATGSESDI